MKELFKYKGVYDYLDNYKLYNAYNINDEWCTIIPYSAEGKEIINKWYLKYKKILETNKYQICMSAGLDSRIFLSMIKDKKKIRFYNVIRDDTYVPVNNEYDKSFVSKMVLENKDKKWKTFE